MPRLGLSLVLLLSIQCIQGRDAPPPGGVGKGVYSLPNGTVIYDMWKFEFPPRPLCCFGKTSGPWLGTYFNVATETMLTDFYYSVNGMLNPSGPNITVVPMLISVTNQTVGNTTLLMPNQSLWNGTRTIMSTGPIHISNINTLVVPGGWYVFALSTDNDPSPTPNSALWDLSSGEAVPFPVTHCESPSWDTMMSGTWRLFESIFTFYAVFSPPNTCSICTSIGSIWCLDTNSCQKTQGGCSSYIANPK
jgi:hypothetical protein